MQQTLYWLIGLTNQLCCEETDYDCGADWINAVAMQSRGGSSLDRLENPLNGYGIALFA